MAGMTVTEPLPTEILAPGDAAAAAAAVRTVAPMDDAALTRGLDSFVARRLVPGERLQSASSSAACLAIVLAGAVREAYEDPRGGVCTRSLRGRGAVLTDAFDPPQAPLAIRAIGGVRILIAAWTDIVELGADEGIWTDFARSLALRQHADAIERERRLALLSPLERYLRLRVETPWMLQEVPQYEIAALLRITPEHLSRIRRRLLDRVSTRSPAARTAG